MARRDRAVGRWRASTAVVPSLSCERAFWDAGLPAVAGVDEVGRGALAGPLVAAAVVLPCCDGAALRSLRARLATLRDSKLLPAPTREALAGRIHAVASDVAIGVVESEELDAVGVAAANRLAMERAVAALAAVPDALLLDACLVDLPLPQSAPIRGDGRCLSVAAASVVAKVVRDALMMGHDVADPRYGFGAHKGYGTASHLQRLRRYGPGPIHRRSFVVGDDRLAHPR